ncbi:MAG TPA: hypothetical protein VFW87_23760 [Pirellulales bacterium]|nr:hypothetical protein [Pirellulales bacterium]
MGTTFIELSGGALLRVVSDEEIPIDELRRLGVADDSLVRVNAEGDVELRRADRWDVIGGLLGDFAERLRRETGREFV